MVMDMLRSKVRQECPQHTVTFREQVEEKLERWRYERNEGELKNTHG